MAQSVWVVDDDQLTRTAVLAVLNDLGYETRGFGNAEELYTTLVDGAAHPQLLSSTSGFLTKEARPSFIHCASGRSIGTSPCCS